MFAAPPVARRARTSYFPKRLCAIRRVVGQRTALLSKIRGRFFQEACAELEHECLACIVEHSAKRESGSFFGRPSHLGSPLFDIGGEATFSVSSLFHHDGRGDGRARPPIERLDL